ncbi:MAG: DUF2207 domain-containing protein [Pseudomonadota bacterium]
MKWLLFFLAVFLTSATKAEEKILSFHSRIQIAADGWLTVTETIVVQAEGRQIQRGILRDFPTDYRDRLGRSVTVPFEVLGVKRDGAAEPWSPARQANGVSLRIGNSNVMLPRGPHTYEITYRTRYQLGFFDDHDELYWNVNGNGWTFAMDSIAAEVALPQAVPAAQLKTEAYTGSFGAKGRDYVAQVRDGGAAFRTTRKLGAGEGLTIVFSFPKGIVTPPTLRERFERWLNDNLGEVFGAAGFLLLLAFLYWRWAAVGRDPRTGPPFPRYEAPKGMGPAAARYLDRMRCDDRCFASALLGLGQRGYLTIRQERGSYELARTGKSVEWLPGEQAVAALAPAQGVRGIGATYDPVVQQARAGLDEALKKHFGEKLFSRNNGSLMFGFVIAAGTMGAMLLFGAVLPVMIALGAAMAIALFAAAKLLPAYTVEGRRLEDEVEGLRQYLSVAEGDDLVRMKMPPRTKEEFARFLPYAVALGVEKTWADAFARVLGASALAAAMAAYYVSSSSDSSYSVGGFTDSIADMGKTISAASTPPSSSSGSSSSGGSSGGGSSGGGGGGGGGSGW